LLKIPRIPYHSNAKGIATEEKTDGWMSSQEMLRSFNEPHMG
jgi:hypothetical protein